MEWDAKLYNDSQNFVAEYGKDLLEFVPAGTNKILDLGCGTGTLTRQLAERCHDVLGMDASDAMIQTAQKSYPQLKFAVADALELSDAQEWDIIFSNAVFHWISDHNLLLQKIHRALKPKGKLICEFGAHGNISIIENGFHCALQEIGMEYRSKFNFPTVEDFEDLLHQNGFVIEQIYDYDRPTPLKDGDQGLYHWAIQFFQSDLEKLSPEQKDIVLDGMKHKLRSKLWNGTCWVADYRRLRVVAAR
ncbi:MAG: class I SAM-dependent methyltransferase [Evtepia sp.]|nr:class I SAM-dependent methyltransferase [Evtepia sp.]